MLNKVCVLGAGSTKYGKLTSVINKMIFLSCVTKHTAVNLNEPIQFGYLSLTVVAQPGYFMYTPNLKSEFPETNSESSL